MKTKLSLSAVRRNDDQLFLTFYRSLGRLGSRLANVYASGHHRKLLSVAINPKGYCDWREFSADYAAVALLKKYPRLNTGIDTRAVALEKFDRSEIRCREVNHNLRWVLKRDYRTSDIFVRARSIVQLILGRFSWDATLPFLAHGPGATFGTKRDEGHPVDKFGCIQPTATGECLALDACYIEWASSLKRFRETNGVTVNCVAGSKIATVPKDARSDRVIAIEPLLNMFYQKGIGGLMRTRLRSAGCDLNDQSVNQRLAAAGSLDESWATIDLANASDSVSSSLVELLLPDDWLVAMKCVRSKYALLPSGEWKFLQKFSSMGNGFTFELESLIFLALGRATIEVRGGEASGISVYGDDICLRPEYVRTYVDLLLVCGFETNVEKSFVDGPFRESCGKHYFRGRDVTPFYVKGDVTIAADRLFWFANSVRRFAHRFLGMGYGCHGSFQALWRDATRLAKQFLPPRLRLPVIPDGVGDGGLVLDWDDARPAPASRGYSGWRYSHLVKTFADRPFCNSAGLLYSLYSLERRAGPAIGSEELRVPSRRYKLKLVRAAATQWPSMGPWVNGY